MKPRAIFLDRDGTLIINRHYLSDPAGVELLPGVRETLHRLVGDGFKLFLFTNQSGVGRGMFTMDAVKACNDRMMDLLGFAQMPVGASLDDARAAATHASTQTRASSSNAPTPIGALGITRPTFTEICIAPEAPDQPMVYRKPSPRFIQEMIAKHSLNPAETWMVGDSEADVQAGLGAGVRTALIGDSARVEPGLRTGLWRCRDLPDFYSRLSAERA